MLPSKNMVDLGETSRFFPTIRIDGDTSLNTYTSPFRSSVNRYSSSTESTSPESFLNVSFPLTSEVNQHPRSISPNLLSRFISDSPSISDNKSNFHFSISNFDTFLQNNNTRACNESSSVFDNKTYEQSQMFNTPFQTRRERPIVGRKILGSHSAVFTNEPKKSDDMSNVWQNNTLQSPSHFHNHYELFPPNETKYGFQSPGKTANEYSPNYMLSRTASVASLSTASLNISPTWNRTMYDPISTFTPPFNPASHTGASSSKDEIGPSKMCMFCRKNGETPTVYMTHCVKERVGNKYKVTCPILRSHICETCGASGDEAHTITYCPILRHTNNGKPLQSTTITLKNTRVKSNGRRRY